MGFWVSGVLGLPSATGLPVRSEVWNCLGASVPQLWSLIHLDPLFDIIWWRSGAGSYRKIYIYGLYIIILYYIYIRIRLYSYRCIHIYIGMGVGQRVKVICKWR
jgi:hypothetical protein